MARKPRSENYDALGSIFNFLFEEAEKPPEKRRSIKPTEVASDREITNAIAAALEMPGAFLTKNIVDEFNRALDIKLAETKFDELADAKVKVSTNSLIDFLRDPEKAFNKAIQGRQEARHAMRATFIRAGMEDFMASAWAHQYGNLEAKAAVRANIAAKEREESFKVSKAMGEYYATHASDKETKILGNTIPGRTSLHETTYLNDRTLNLLGRMTLGSSWDTLSPKDRIEFASLISNGGAKQKDIQKYITRKYGSTAAMNFQMATGKKPEDTISVFDTDLYKTLEKNNLNEKIQQLANAPTGSPQEEERRIYKKTLLLLEDRNDVVKQIASLKYLVKTAPTPADKKALQHQLRDAQGALRVMDGHTVFGQIGKWEGYLGSLNNIYGGVTASTLVPNILNGKFYNVDDNVLFNPVKEENIAGIFKVKVAKSSKNKLINEYNKMGTALYYVTPASLFKTFFVNGEGFAYRLYNNFDRMRGNSGFAKLDQMGIKTDDIIEGINKNFGKKLDTFIEAQLNNISTKGLTAEEYRRVERLLNSSKSLRNLTYAFSFPARKLGSITKRIDDFWKDSTAGIRKAIGNKILNSKTWAKLLAKTGADKLLLKWIANGGIEFFVRSMVTAVAGALGIAVGPIGSAIITALTWIATDLAMKLLGAGINILKWAAIGLVAIPVLLGVAGYSAFTKFNRQTFSYRSATPGSIVQCALYEEQDLEPGEEGGWDDNVVIPPPSGEACVLGSGSFWCSQGYKDVDGWSHQNMKAKMPVDLTQVSYIYAPQFCDSGNCSITRIAKINCSDGKDAGGIVEYDANDGKTTYHFKLLHVQPLAAQGERLSGGQPVAVVMDGFEPGWCWTGKHLHLETTQNGSSVDPLDLLQSFNCGVPDESSCNRP